MTSESSPLENKATVNINPFLMERNMVSMNITMMIRSIIMACPPTAIIFYIFYNKKSIFALLLMKGRGFFALILGRERRR